MINYKAFSHEPKHTLKKYWIKVFKLHVHFYLILLYKFNVKGHIYCKVLSLITNQITRCVIYYLRCNNQYELQILLCMYVILQLMWLCYFNLSIINE